MFQENFGNSIRFELFTADAFAVEATSLARLALYYILMASTNGPPSSLGDWR